VTLGGFLRAAAPRTRWAACVRALLGLLMLSGTPWALSQNASEKAQTTASAGAGERSVSDWLMRMHEASRRRSYVGTFVVQAGGYMSSARIWHACDGDVQMERVEALTGEPRSTFRRNDQVVTFSPLTRVAVAERRESLGLFPNLLQSADSAIAQFYRVRHQGTERVAGVEADVVQLRPADTWRFGYRISSERKTGLVVKLQTLDAQGRVLEQAAFSELQLDAPVSMTKLGQLMANTEGYQLERPALLKTSAAEEGWYLKTQVPGFKPMSCFKRAVASGAGSPMATTFQWVFSDGLASVSLFVNGYDARIHAQTGALAMGATHTLTRRIGDWWLTAVGEVPAHTLLAFAQALERKN
jgi:sigma-E factor negative regulatory protein RseB